MKFYEVALAYDALRPLTSRLAITQKIAALLQEASPEEAQYIAYLSLGELYPPYQGVIFGIAEKSAYKIVAQVLDMPLEQIKKTMQQHGDIGDVIAKAESAWDMHESLTVSEVYHELCAIAQISGQGSQEARFVGVKHLLQRLDVLSAALVMRILIGKLRLGFSDMTVIDALSWMLTGGKGARAVIERAYNISADIGRIVFLARSGGLAALEKIEVVLGIPIRPAAAERLSNAREIIEKVGPCVVQPKLDGFRIQVHVWHDTQGRQRVRFFSRNLQSMAGMFPELERAVCACITRSMIIEGEALAYDEETGAYLHFQETVKRRRKHNIASIAVSYPLRLVLFDILYEDGVSLLDMAHAHRYERLQLVGIQCSHTTNNALTVIDEIRVATTAQLEHYFTQMVAEGLEGIIAKRDEAAYQPGKRNFNWIKLKRQAFGSTLEDTIDALVLGYYYGRGKRSAFGIGACLIGVYDDKKEIFVTIAKVGTGFSDAEWKQLKEWCDQHAMEHRPANVVCDMQLYPNVWVEPGLVLEIAADEITRSPLHTAAKNSEGYGLALRFPRMVSFRADKSVLDVTTVEELVHLSKKSL